MSKRVATQMPVFSSPTLRCNGDGYGYLSEYGLKKIVPDLSVHQILEGSNETMRHFVGRIVADSPAHARR